MPADGSPIDYHKYYREANFGPTEPTKPPVIRTFQVNGVTRNVIKEPIKISVSAEDQRNSVVVDTYWF